jgi:hypothetical protein
MHYRTGEIQGWEHGDAFNVLVVCPAHKIWVADECQDEHKTEQERGAQQVMRYVSIRPIWFREHHFWCSFGAPPL